MKQKQHFVEGEEVIIHALDDNGTEYEGIICGLQEMPLMDFYIVRFKNPDIVYTLSYPPYKFSCVMITEACLKRVSNTLDGLEI